MTMPPRHPRAPRQRRRRTAATTATVALLALTSSSLVLKPVRAAASADNANGGAQSGRLQLPPLHYSADLSFRGVLDGGKLEGFDISGHASGLPGNHDFLRLVPANPMAHGALFSQRKMEAEEWVAEIAFRVHGPPTVGIVEVVGDDGETRTTKVHKGGRGLAFWYSKSGSPGPVTISSDPKVVVSVPPPVIPGSPTDVSDPNVSLFGYRTQFDGLGIVFDTSPNSPLYLRSDSRNWEIKDTSSVGMGVGTSGVVSGILDDGTGSWIEPKGRVMKEDDEAAYLDKAVGECEAAFRNAQGLLWARVSYINQTIRVDLDLAPHTTLAKAGRDYAHNCFTLPGIKLTPGNYFGLTGLASGNAEPDSVDVYAMDVFEVVKVKEGTAPPPATSDEPPEERQPHILEGTVEDAVSSLAHEIFLSQARMVEAIDALARRVETLARHMGQGRGPVRQREGVPETGSNVA
ncbi:concanavalin A-like lectin/glucanase [Meredithblackwellia eburnea MCA 4105]